MWLVLPSGFISLVVDKTDSSKVWIRARVRGDIEMFLPEEYTPLIQTMPKADYTYRICVPKEVVAFQMWNQIIDLDYTSHAKEAMNSRSTPNAARMSAYYGCWSELAEMQDYTPYTGIKRVVGRSWRTVKSTFTSTTKKSKGTGITSPGLFSAGDYDDEVQRPAGSIYDEKSTTRIWDDNGHYNWDTHPQSSTYRPTGFRNGKPVVYDTESSAWVDDQGGPGMSEEQWDGLLADKVTVTPERGARRGRKFSHRSRSWTSAKA